jgi:hypothetical protein
MSAGIEVIRSKAHWDASVRPDSFDPHLLSEEALDTVIGTIPVRLRGWPVPFIDTRIPVGGGDDWIGQDLQEVEEAWRLFRSGQFTHLRVISRERRRPDVGPEEAAAPSKVIELWDILLYVTEITELAARLALSARFPSGTEISLRLHCGVGRLLISGTPERHLDRDYRSISDTIEVSRTLERAELVGSAREVAVQIATQYCRRFGFKPTPGVLSEYQTQLVGPPVESAPRFRGVASFIHAYARSVAPESVVTMRPNSAPDFGFGVYVDDLKVATVALSPEESDTPEQLQSRLLELKRG